MPAPPTCANQGVPKRKKPPLAARASRSGESCDDGRYTEQAQGHIQLHDDGETKVLAHSNVPRPAPFLGFKAELEPYLEESTPVENTGARWRDQRIDSNQPPT